MWIVSCLLLLWIKLKWRALNIFWIFEYIQKEGDCCDSVSTYLTLVDNAKIFFQTVVPVNILTSRVGEFYCSVSSSTLGNLSLLNTNYSVERVEISHVVWVCGYLMLNNRVKKLLITGFFFFFSFSILSCKILVHVFHLFLRNYLYFVIDLQFNLEPNVIMINAFSCPSLINYWLLHVIKIYLSIIF